MWREYLLLAVDPDSKDLQEPSQAEGSSFWDSHNNILKELSKKEHHSVLEDRE